ncbi:MAG: hypothetical protein EOO99_12015 [Pedobacter sp.]|nr:MAG: hypothetical protein EOO99_12015 [Pedobacter sp.]
MCVYPHTIPKILIRIWYAFLEKDNDRIIQYMEKIFIEEFEKCKEAYRHKDFFIDPSHLKMIFPDLKIFRIIQQPGDYVITGPGVYHQGFNQGFNLAYAVNIGISIWLPLLQKVKPCLCLGQGWRLKIEETKKIFTNAEEIIPSFDVTSQHFAKFRAPFFLLITYHSDILNIQRLIKFYAANTALGRPYLAVLDEPFQNVIIDGQVFALRKYHVKIAHKERKTVPVTSINQLIRNNSEYKNLLKSCMIIPFYLRSYKSQLENLISRKSIWVPIEYFKINSLTLYQIFQTHKWKINQDILEILACRKEDNNNDNNDNNDDDDNDEEDDDDDERAIETKQNILLNQPFLQQQFISVAFAELKEEACYQMALVDNDGIVRINSTISKTLTGRQSFWKQNLSKFFLSNTLKIIVPNQKLFHEIFLNEMKPFFVGLEILELSSQADVDDITTVNKKTIEILKARKEFQYINFESKISF